MSSAVPPPIPSGSGRRKPSFWRSPLGCLAIGGFAMLALVFAALMALGFAIEAGYFPDTAVVAGKELPGRVKRLLREHDILGPDETVLFFYSAGFLDYLEDGNMLTDARVVSYQTYDDELFIDAATYAEITEIEPEWSEDLLWDTSIDIVCEDGSSITLIVSTENGGDRRFYDRLQAEWRSHRPPDGR